VVAESGLKLKISVQSLATVVYNQLQNHLAKHTRLCTGRVRVKCLTSRTFGLTVKSSVWPWIFPRTSNLGDNL
jgi:hypothetical protein